MGNFRDLTVYKKAFELAMIIFELTQIISTRRKIRFD